MDAFRNDMHGRLLRDEIPVYDYLIELAPFALVFMTTRELSYMGARISNRESLDPRKVRAASKRSFSLSFSPP